jgi:hypothetical protein
MVRKIIFTAKEYKEKYFSLMQSFLLEYEDYEEIDFINNEIEIYNLYKNDVTYYKEFWNIEQTNGYLCSHGTDAPDEQITDLVVGWREKRNATFICDAEPESFYIDKPLCLKIAISFNKIIQFLEHKKGNPIQSKNNSKASLTISEIALKYVYEGAIITRENAKNFLLGTGYTSGDRLYNEFCKWSNYNDRKADPQSKVKLNNRIKLFEKVIAELPENKKEKAKDELKILYSFKPRYE